LKNESIEVKKEIQEQVDAVSEEARADYSDVYTKFFDPQNNDRAGLSVIVHYSQIVHGMFSFFLYFTYYFFSYYFHFLYTYIFY